MLRRSYAAWLLLYVACSPPAFARSVTAFDDSTDHLSLHYDFAPGPDNGLNSVFDRAVESSNRASMSMD